MSDINTLLQLYGDMSDGDKKAFVAAILAPTKGTVNKPTAYDSREAYLAQVKGERPSCPHCNSEHIVKNGFWQKKTQRYLCRDCGKAFVLATRTLLAFTQKDISTWQKYIDCMMEGLSLRKAATICDISLPTSFAWRHKILDALQNMAESVNLDGIVEADETYFRVSYKGNHKKSSDFSMPRKAKKRGSPAEKRGLSKEQVCAPCAVNRNGLSIAKVSNLGIAGIQDLRFVLGGRIEEGSILCTDKAHSYKKFSSVEKLNLVQMNAGKRTKGMFNIQHINSYHSQLKKFMDKFNGVSTKYLNNYLVWNNIVNYAKEPVAEKQDIFFKFVTTTETHTRCATLSKRATIPVRSLMT